MLLVNLLFFIFGATFTAAQVDDGQCTGQIIPKDGPKGFGTSYRVGNRLTVDSTAALSSVGYRTTITKDLAGAVEITIKYNIQKNSKTMVSIQMRNMSNKPVIAQYAMYRSLQQDPYQLFNILAEGALGFNCAVFDGGLPVSSPVTIQAYHPSH